MKRVLVYGMTENYGGIESVIINYFRNIPHNKVHFDFISNTHEPIAYQEEVLKKKSKIFFIPRKEEDFRNYKNKINEFFSKHHDYDAIWVNRNDLINIDYLKMAKKYNIRKRIIHSHNTHIITSDYTAGIKTFIHYVNKLFLNKYATDYWACSFDAAKWFYFGKSLSESVIINNAIETEEYKFNKRKREELQHKYKLSKNFIIGNVGRLTFQKNQIFLLYILKEVKKEIPNIKLVIVGQGDQKENILKKANDLNLSNNLFLPGMQKNVKDWYNVFDVFVFPSKFEGFGLAALEAQANGIPIVASSVIPNNIKVNPNFYKKPLDKSVKEWAGFIINILKKEKRLEYTEIKRNFVKTGFDIKTEAQKLLELLYD